MEDLVEENFSEARRSREGMCRAPLPVSQYPAPSLP